MIIQNEQALEEMEIAYLKLRDQKDRMSFLCSASNGTEHHSSFVSALSAMEQRLSDMLSEIKDLERLLYSHS